MSAQRYSTITIIYNPRSSGEARNKATRLYKRLKRRKLNHLHILATEYAGHAEEIAYRTAAATKQPLIISVSGDGGYNEVINGVLRATNEGVANKPVCAILAAGNANDHRRTVRKRPLLYAVLRSEPEPIDILSFDARFADQQVVRYAHSYIGFGFTSVAAAELNRERLTRWKELKIVLRTLMKFQPISITLPNGSRQLLASLVFANIHQMSKVMKLGQKTDLHNGLFRVVAVPHRSRLRFLLTMLSIATVGFKHPPQQAAFEFDVRDTQLVHLDGEVTKVPGGSHITVEAAKEALLTLR